MMKIRRAKRSLVSRIDRLWRRYFCEDVEYFYASYRSRDSEREYEEGGVLSAPTIHHAARKADMARKVLGTPGWAEDCRLESLVPISIRMYRALKRRIHNIYDIDSFFDKYNKLIV
jgi:hypothetical protein